MNNALKRTRFLSTTQQPRLPKSGQVGTVIYWMIRDQRVHSNWALTIAQQKAIELEQSLTVVVTLRPDLTSHHGTERMLDFMLSGLEEVSSSLREKHIGFHVGVGDPVSQLTAVAETLHASYIVTDFFPLRIYLDWQHQVAAQLSMPVVQVDAHNLIPCWEASDKQEWAARTIRPKLHRQLDTYLEPLPQIKTHPFAPSINTQQSMTALKKVIKVDTSVKSVSWAKPGEKAAQQALKSFTQHTLASYHLEKNDPTLDALSNLSAHLHFGQLSAQQIVLEVSRAPVSEAARESFIEEVFVRKELADNFCFYQPKYDSLLGAPQWARATLTAHLTDEREFMYSLDEFEQAVTHDEIWNAAQQQLLHTGKIHGYMRMYWAKKILEWSKDPGEAIKMAIYLNDHYSLDGRDPNGYAGILWSIAGLHDRPWFERPIYGSIRYMNDRGLRKKFPVDEYVKRWQPAVT